MKFSGSSSGTVTLSDGRIEIRTIMAGPDGARRKSTILDGTTGLVLEQHLFTPTGERLASVRTSRHRVDPSSGAALPRLVEVSWPASGVEFQLELTSITTNMPPADPGQLWQMPSYEGFQPIDLADPAVTITGPADSVGAPPAATPLPVAPAAMAPQRPLPAAPPAGFSSPPQPYPG
jgi:hypothetical protein